MRYIHIYIYIYSCWCFNYAWCMRYYSGISTHMQSIEIQHMQSQRTMHVDKSQRPRLGHAITKSHFNSSLTFLKALEHPRTSHFPRVHAKIWILTSLLSLFLLRKVLGSSLESSSQVQLYFRRMTGGYSEGFNMSEVMECRSKAPNQRIRWCYFTQLIHQYPQEEKRVQIRR